MTPQQSTPHDNARRSRLASFPRSASHWQWLRRLGLSLLLALLLYAPLVPVPAAYAAPGISITPTSGLVTTETGGTAYFTVVLNERPSANVTINLSNSDATEGSLSSSSLVFTQANWSVPQIVTITGVNDDVDDGNIAYSIVTTTSSTDAGYSAINPADVSVSNTDNDTKGITVSGINRNTTEDGGTATFTVVLNSQPTATVTINLSSSDTTEGTVSPTSLTFTPGAGANVWNTLHTVTVTGQNDGSEDGDINYTINTAAATGGDYAGIDAANVAVSNIDNENGTARVRVTNISSTSTTEAGTNVTFRLRMNVNPGTTGGGTARTVTLTPSSSDTTEGTVTGTGITFTGGFGGSADWDEEVVVTVTRVDDSLDDGDIPYTINFAVSTTGGGGNPYSGITVAPLRLTNTDNDAAGITVSPASGDTTEAAPGSPQTFTVVLTSQPTSDVVVPLTSSDTTEGTVSPASLTFTAGAGPNVWNTPHTVTVTGVDDSVDDGNINYTIATDVSTSDTVYAQLSPADRSLTNIDNDTAGYTISAISGDTSEAGGTASFTMRLNTQPIDNVYIGLTSGDATEGSVSPASLTFTTSNWNTNQTVTVTGVDDTFVDGNISYSIVTSAASSHDVIYAAVNPADVSVINTDDDVLGYTISAISGNTSEAGGTVTFTMRLNGHPSDAVTIDLSSSDTTEGTVSPTSLVFSTGEWEDDQTVTVTGVDDDVVDGNINFSIVTAVHTDDPAYAALDPADVSVTNTDDDTAGYTISAISGNTSEAGDTASFTVKLNSQPTADVHIALSSSDATEGLVSTVPLTFTASTWDDNQTVIVTGVDDNIIDGDIGYSIVTAVDSSDGIYAALNPADVGVTNTDDDVAGVTFSAISGNTSEAGGTASFTAQLTSQPSADVYVGLSSDDPTEGIVGTVPLTFTTSTWATPQTVIVTGVDDSLDDDNVTFAIVTTPSSADTNYSALGQGAVSVTNADDDVAGVIVSAISGNTTEAGGSATFTVVLNSEPTGDVVIGVGSSNNAAEGIVGTEPLTFTAITWTMPQTVTVTGVDELIDDGDTAYTVQLASPTSADAKYSALTLAPVDVTNIDDDGAGVTVTNLSGHTTEAGGVATFGIRLNTQPTADVQVGLSSSDTTEGVLSTVVVTFTTATWNITQTVTVTGVDDLIDDGDIDYSIVTAAATSTDLIYDGEDSADIPALNEDNDTAGITVTNISGNTTEAGGTATFTVKLNSQPSANVTIGLSSNDTTEGTVSPASLVFTTANWNTPKTVTVKGVHDLVVDGNVAYKIITAPATSSDTSYSQLNAADVNVINVDNAVVAGVTVSAISGNTSEAGATRTFTVKLSRQPTANVTINLSSSDTTEGTVSPASLVFTTANWNTPKTVTVKGVDDKLVDGNISYKIITSAASSTDAAYNGLVVADVTVVNNDDPGNLDGKRLLYLPMIRR